MSADLAAGADIETGALVLVGEAEAFRWLSRCLRDRDAITLELKPVTGRPALRPIARFRLEPAGHLATIEIRDESATLSGDQESWTRLADEADLFLEHNDLTEPGIHAHLDHASWSSAEPLLGPGSHSLTLAGPGPASA
jgi:hypothetical protein